MSLENSLTKYYLQSTEIPQEKELEMVVLGAIMVDSSAMDNLASGFNRECFYHDQHKFIFDSMLKLRVANNPIDLVTVMEKLKSTQRLNKAGGPAYLAELTNRVASAANIEYHSRILMQSMIKRQCIRIGAEAIRRGSSPEFDSLDLVHDMEAELFKLVNLHTSGSIKTGSQIAMAVAKRITSARNSTSDIVGLPTGFKEIDRIFSGLQAPDLWCIAARPGMGKTAFVLGILRFLTILMNIPVGMFSLEMEARQLGDRLAAMEARIPGSLINNPKGMEEWQWQQLDVAIQRIDNSPIFIDDTPGINIFEMRSKARKMVREHGVKVIIVDYLQLMDDPTSTNREQQISNISRGLKAMARELDVMVIELSQLSRAVEVRGGMKRPQLSDLRESGSIEQDADIVSFLYRPEYYQIKEDQHGNSTEGLAEVITAKNRRGPLTTTRLKFEHEFTLFRDFMDSSDFDEVLDKGVQLDPNVQGPEDEDLPF